MQTVTAFSTEHIPAASRTGYFQRQMEQLFSIGLDLEPAADQPFRTEVTAYSRRALKFAALRFSPHVSTRGRVWSRRTCEPQFVLTANKGGAVFVAQDGRECWVAENELIVLDVARDFYIDTSDVLTYAIRLPASAMRSVTPHVDALTARVIDGSRGSGAVFRALVDELFAQGDALSDKEADDIAGMLPHALAPALMQLDVAAQPSPSRLRVLHKHRIKRFVRERLADPALDVQAIADHIQLSARYVHELFSDEPESLTRWIWSARLEGCRRELGAGNVRTVGEVAYGWGFVNLAHFSRAFRGRFGMSPSEFRKLGLG